MIDPLDPDKNHDEKQAEWLAFIEATAGSLADDPIERPPQSEYQIRDEME
jgi:hypothetical protein